MSDIKSRIQQAYDMVDRGQKDAALKLVGEILANLSAPDRIHGIPPARTTIYDWLWKAQKGLAGEAEIVPPKAALWSALILAH